MNRDLIGAIAIEIIGIIVILAGILALLISSNQPTAPSAIAFGSALVAIGSLWFSKVYGGGTLQAELADRS